MYPAAPLPEPPKGANEAAFYLLRAFNEAMEAIPTWPKRQPAAGSDAVREQTLYGRRRMDWFSRHENGFATELKTNALVQNLVDSQWRCEATDHSEAARLSLKPNGDAVGLYGRTGRWGTMNDPELGEECAPHACLFVDIGSNRMNAAVSPPDDKTKLTLMATPAWGAAHGAPASRRERWSCSRV